jgi:hypothetical protein
VKKGLGAHAKFHVRQARFFGLFYLKNRDFGMCAKPRGGSSAPSPESRVLAVQLEPHIGLICGIHRHNYQ